ncbi:MAG TPA: hypothetical protein VHL32_05150, partial [Gemmatimonadaceae bacterium]|nr:hypothetical protein [Gemmatimonadaceae bacterium]
GVGCVMTFAGFFGGGMIAVLIAKIVGSVQGCKPLEGLPACNWWVYAGIGAVIGAVTLPVGVLLLLNRRRRNA